MCVILHKNIYYFVIVKCVLFKKKKLKVAMHKIILKGGQGAAVTGRSAKGSNFRQAL